MEKRGFSIVPERNRNLDQYERTPVLRVPQVKTDSRVAPPQVQQQPVIIINNIHPPAEQHCEPVEVAYYPPPVIPRRLCPPPFAPPFAFYPSPCSMQQPKPFCFR